MVLTEAAGDAVSDRESLNSPTKEAEPRQPSLKVFTVSQEKNCYLLYAAAEQVDHQSRTSFAQQITIIASGNNTSIVIH
jgi:hypothetical protein